MSSTKFTMRSSVFSGKAWPGRPSQTRLVTPKLLWKIEKSGSGPGELSTPTDIAFLPNRHLVVAELKNKRIQVFDQHGNSVKMLGEGKIQPRGITIEKEGDDVYVAFADIGDNTVKKANVNTGEITSWPANKFVSPSGITLSRKGKFVVTDIGEGADTPKVSVCEPDGTVILRIGSSSPGADDYLIKPNYVSVDQYNRIIVADWSGHCVKAFDQTGRHLLTFGEDTLKYPNGVHADYMDNILVCDNGNNQVSLYSAAGNYIQEVLCKQDGMCWPEGLAVSDGGVLAVTENGLGTESVKVYQV